MFAALNIESRPIFWSNELEKSSKLKCEVFHTSDYQQDVWKISNFRFGAVIKLEIKLIFVFELFQNIWFCTQNIIFEA